LGVKFALDDFGAGFSSLSYLKDLTVDCLKIDRSFIQEILVNKKNIELVEVIINLGKIFKLEIVAEGVETVEECIVLMRYGCDTVQGYMISKPMLGSSVINWVESYTPESQWYDWKDIFWDKKDFPLLMAEVDHIVWIEKVIKETLNN
jgi:EAL domain-containing protein (putative c-di-GMP-specific phosphodiesterase class I)